MLRNFQLFTMINYQQMIKSVIADDKINKSHHKQINILILNNVINHTLRYLSLQLINLFKFMVVL